MDSQNLKKKIRSVLQKICGYFAFRQHSKKIQNKLREWIFVVFNIQSHINKLQEQNKFWQNEYKASLTDIDELNDEIQQYWRAQKENEKTILTLKQTLNDAQQKIADLENALQYYQQENQSQAEKHAKEMQVSQQDLLHQKTLAALDSETIAFLAQAQTDLYFKGNLQVLRGWPLISIIMPVWNQAETVAETVKSVLAQIYPYWELIIVDDGSTDNTKQQLDKYLQDSRITYYLKEHSGVHIARNVGLAKCQGELIAYLDSDKIWSRHVLSVVVNAFLCDAKCKAVYFAAVRQDFIANKKWVYFPEKIVQEKYSHLKTADVTNSIDINCFVHHRSLYDQLGKLAIDLRSLTDNELTYLYQKQTTIKRLSLLGTYYQYAITKNMLPAREHAL